MRALSWLWMMVLVAAVGSVNDNDEARAAGYDF